MSRFSRAFYGTVTSFFQYAVQIGLQLLLAPLLLNKAGQETLGAYAAISQAVIYLGLLDLGFSFSLSRFAEQAYGYSDSRSRMRDVLTAGRSILIVSGFIFAFFTVLLSFSIGTLLNLSPTIERQAATALQLLAIWIVVRSPIKIYGISLIAVQDLSIRNIIRSISSVLRLMLSILLVWMGMGLVGLMISTIIAEGVDMLLCWLRFGKKHSIFHIGWKLPDHDLFIEISKFTFPVLLMTLATRLIYYTDNLVAGIIFGAAAASIYYSTQMPSLVTWNLISRITDSATPAMNELYAREQLERLQSAFVRLYRYILMIALPIAIAIMLLNERVIAIWVSPSQYAGNKMTLALAIFVVLVPLSHLQESILVLNGNIKIYSSIRILEGIGNLLLSFLLAKLMGLEGIMWATVVMSIPAFIYSQGKSSGFLELSMKDMVRKSILPIAGVAFLSGIFLFFMLIVFGKSRSISMLVFVGGMYAAIYLLLLWYLGLTISDRKLLQNYVLRFL